MVGTEMYAKIQKLKRLGYKKQQAARELDIDTKTARKYWEMDEERYAEYLLESKERGKCMDPYRAYVLAKLQEHREITSAIIYDNLLEEFADFKPSYRSVRRYVCELREEEGLQTPHKIRQYMEVAETPLGFQGQVDMGVKTMTDALGKKVRVYIFAMVLSSSRYKYVCFQREPFTAQSFCRAHDQAFKYFGGRPCEIVYDQDRVMVVSENGGDIIYTETFEIYKDYAGFSVHLCRGNDPESKGKIESVIKYVKGNFLAFRTFYGISRLNSNGLQWLDRTGNGQIHNTTKIIPAVAFREEMKHLKAAPELGETQIPPKLAIIRKNNVVMYRQNRYCMPNGTYRPSRQARIEEDGNILRFFDAETDEPLEELPLAVGVGKCVRNTHPQRDRRTQHKDLLDKALAGFGGGEQAMDFIERMLELKPRYTRDQLCILIRLQEKYDRVELMRAIDYCLQRELFTATDFGDTLEYFSLKTEPSKNSGVPLPIKYSVVRAQERPLDAYAGLVKAGDTI